MLKGVNRKTIFIHIAIICAVVLALYARVTNNKYVDLDDTRLIVNNYPFLKDFSNVPQAFKQGIFKLYNAPDTEASYFRPVMTLSFMLDAHLSPSGPNQYISPKPFLAANVFYHLLACILLLLLLYALEVSPFPALLLALVFAVHPILLQAIAWIPGRNDSLVSLFILTSILMLIRYVQTEKLLHIGLHYLFFTIALFTKENAVVFPLLAIFYLYLVNKKPVRIRKYAAIISAYAVIIVAWFFIRQHALAANSSSVSLQTGVKNLFANMPMLFQYIGKSVIPLGLSVMSTIQDTKYLIAILAIGLIACGIYFSKERENSKVAFGLVWFLAFLAPSFFVLFTGLEHRDYLPLVGFIIVASQVDGVKNLKMSVSPNSNAMTLGVMVAVIALFAGKTYLREPIFENAYNFDENAIKTSPHAVLPCLYLAKHYEEVQDYEKAIDAYKMALERDSTSYMIYNSMGGDYMAMRNPDEAAKEFEKEVAMHPNNAMALFNLGLYNLSLGKDSVAIDYGKRTISADIDFVNGYKLLGVIYRKNGDSIHAAPYIKWLQDRGYSLPPQQ